MLYNAGRLPEGAILARITEIVMLARVGHKDDKEKLSKLGVQSIVIPEWEASYTFAKKLLKMSDIDVQERRRVLSILRKKT